MSQLQIESFVEIATQTLDLYARLEHTEASLKHAQADNQRLKDENAQIQVKLEAARENVDNLSQKIEQSNRQALIDAASTATKAVQNDALEKLIDEE